MLSPSNMIFLTLVVMALSCDGCSKEETVKRSRLKTIKLDEIQDRDGVYYVINSETPFTGLIKQHGYGALRKHEFHCRNGYKHGADITWFKSGQKLRQTYYIDGKRHGVDTEWYDNGQMCRQMNYKNGKMHGVESQWRSLSSWPGWRVGNRYKVIQGRMLKSEQKYKDGKVQGATIWQLDSEKLHGIYTIFYTGAKKAGEVSFTNGVMHGTLTEWYESGKVMRKVKYVKGMNVSQHQIGKLISKKIDINMNNITTAATR